MCRLVFAGWLSNYDADLARLSAALAALRACAARLFILGRGAAGCADLDVEQRATMRKARGPRAASFDKESARPMRACSPARPFEIAIESAVATLRS